MGVIMKKLFLAGYIFLSFSLVVFADPFNSKLTASQREKLEKGEVLIKNIDSMKKASVKEIPQTVKILNTMKKLDPSYVAEVIQIRPYEGNEDLRERINDALLNIEDYVGIPYFSERQQKWYELYSSAEIKNTTKNENKTVIDCILEMSLFGKFKSEIFVEENEDYYFYQLRNIDKLVYHNKFTAVKPKKMVSCITLFRDGDNWVLYAIGGVDVPKIWFLEDRIETSFMNRIKTFCNFIFEKI